MGIQPMSSRVCVLEVDFSTTESVPLSKSFELEAIQDGVVHAIVASWNLWSDGAHTHKMSTHYEETKEAPWGFVRDMHWGQAFQLVEDEVVPKRHILHTLPVPFVVHAGERLLLTARFLQPDGRNLQFSLRRARRLI